MLKINQIWDEENFQVRAGTSARYILHRIYKILKKRRFFHVFCGDYGYEYIRFFRRYRHVFKTKNVRNQSNFHSVKSLGAGGNTRTLYFTSCLQDFEKYGYEYVRCFKRYRHVFKTNNVQNESLNNFQVRAGKCEPYLVNTM